MEQMTQPTMQHSHKGLYVTITLSLGAAAILLIVVLAMILTKHPTVTRLQQQTAQYQPSQTMQEQTPSSVQSQVQQVTPLPIATKQNLDSATQTLNSTDMSQITTGLNQNGQDASNFNQ